MDSLRLVQWGIKKSRVMESATVGNNYYHQALTYLYGTFKDRVTKYG